MNLSQLQQGLEQAFYTEQHRIVFWYDAEQSFTEEIKALELNDVHILNSLTCGTLDHVVDCGTGNELVCSLIVVN